MATVIKPITPGSKVHAMLKIINHCQAAEIEIPYNLFVHDISTRAYKAGFVEQDTKNENYGVTWTVHLTSLGEQVLQELNAGQTHVVTRIVNEY